MSGNYGWGGNDRGRDFYAPSRNDGFSRARDPYYRSTYAPPPDDPPPSRSPGSSVKMTGTLDDNVNAMKSAVANRAGEIDLSPAKRQKTKAKNVVIVAPDITGSMGGWRDEMFKRLALFYKETQGFLGDDLEMVFIGFDDVPKGGRMEVTPIGAGPILDTYLAKMNQDGGGGGNAVESSDLAAFYVHEMLDTSSAQNVYFFTITDEGFYDLVGGGGSDALNIFGGTRSRTTEARPSAQIFKDLKVRMNVFTILAENTGNDYSRGQRDRIKTQWRETLGSENVVVLNDARRIVDIMLGVMAKTTGQDAKFSRTLMSRQGGTQFGSENIANVQKSLANVPGGPQTPSAKAGTKSLLDLDAMSKL